MLTTPTMGGTIDRLRGFYIILIEALELTHKLGVRDLDLVC